MGKILTLGEGLLRLSTTVGERVATATSLQLHYGGAEYNVAVNLANFGHSVSYATKLPRNALGDGMLLQLQQHAVSTQHVLRGGNRMGTYYLETGVGPRASNVIYDRKYSALSEMQSLEWELDALFDNVSVFHITGITLGVAPAWQRLGYELIKAAHQRGIMVSFDMNYRPSLWDSKAAKQAFLKVLPYVDILSAGPLDAAHFFDIESATTLSIPMCLTAIRQRFPHVQYIYCTQRQQQSANEYSMVGYLLAGEVDKVVSSAPYTVRQVVDRVGTGDSFTAGLLHGVMQQWSLQQTIDFAMASGVLKHTVLGDVNLFNEAEILHFSQNTQTILR